MKLIIGIGNPGKEYENTRHNVGFIVLDHYLKNETMQEKFNALYCKKNINGEVVYFIKPLTFVNLSGEAVKKYVDYFNIDLNDILVIQDDLDEPFGQYKLKKDSSSGGHNGIKSIIKELNSNKFARLKIGIDIDDKKNIIDFVLSKFSPEEQKYFKENANKFDSIINSFIKDGIDKTMNIYNTK